jgi:(2Fe-2S) ferredoxin
MSRKRKRATPSVENGHGPLVVVCRGGDCGSRVKHPDTAHREQLDTFREALGRSLVISRCLDACENSNVVVLVPGSAELEDGAEPVWVGEVNDDDTVQDVLAAHARPGGELPTLVQIKEFRPTRRNRHELEEELPD